MIDIKLEEPSSLTIEMKIEGDVKDEAAQLRFSVLAEGIRYSFNSTETEDGVYKIDFPTMTGKITEGVYPAEIEIIVDGKHFVPLEETVKFIKEIKPTVKLSETVAQVQGDKVNVRMGAVRVIAPKKTISDVRGLLACLQESEEIDTSFALDALNKFALNESATLGNFNIAPKKALAESEAIAALRIIGSSDSTDVSASDLNISGIKAISEKVASQLGDVLGTKGVSARALKSLGL
jgi:hypothetical protein